MLDAIQSQLDLLRIDVITDKEVELDDAVNAHADETLMSRKAYLIDLAEEIPEGYDEERGYEYYEYIVEDAEAEVNEAETALNNANSTLWEAVEQEPPGSPLIDQA